MKFSFKRFLSSALAAVMTASVLSVGMVSSVSAVTNTYVIPTGLTMPSSNGHTVDLYGSTDKYPISYLKGDSKDAFLTLDTAVSFEGAEYKTALNTGSDTKGYLIINKVNAGDTITVVYGNQNKAANTFTISDAINDNKGVSATPTVKDNATSNPLTSKGAPSKVSHKALASGTYYAGYSASKGEIYAIIIEEAPKGTGSITGKVSGIEPSAAPKGKFYCNTDVFTVDPVSGDYTISNLSDGQYTLKYVGTDYSMVEQTVTVSGGGAVTQNLELTKLDTVTVSGTIVSTDNTGIPASAKIAISYGSGKTGESSITFPEQGDPTFSIEGVLADSGSATLSITGADDYTLSGDTSINIAKDNVTAALKLSYSKDTVEVLPDTDGKYDFTNATGTLLTFDPKDPQSAYSKFNAGGSADVNYVSLSSAGAKLEDNSSATTSLVVPCKATSGTVTISGSVTPTAALGSKWKLVDFGVIAISTDGANSSTALTFTTNNQDPKDPASPDLGNIAKDKKITYTVTIDLDNHKASANIINENGNKTADFKDVEFTGDSISHVTFATNGSGSADKARALLIPDITIKGAEEPKPVTVGSTVEGGKTYVFAGVAEDHTGDADTLVVYGSSKDTTAEDIKTNGKELFTTDTVYDSVQDVPTPGTVQGKVFAHEVKVDTVTSKTINIVAYLGNVASDVASVTVSK